MRLFDWQHRVDLRDELQEIYLHRFFVTLAMSTVAVFIPLYIVESGHPPVAVFLFYIVFYGVFILLAWPAARLAARMGYKHTSLASAPVLILFYLFLRVLPPSSLLVYGVAAVGGVAFITYWIGMNSEMARSSHGETREEETGYFFSMPLIAAVIAPFTGGLIVDAFSFPVLFTLAALLILVSFLPFLFSREHYTGMELEVRDFLRRELVVDAIAFAARGGAGIGRKVLWPLYLAVVITGSVTIGGAGSLLALGGALASIVLGRLSSRTRNAVVIATGGVLSAASYIAMAFVTTPRAAFLVAFVNGVSFFAATLPLYSDVLGAAETEDILEYFAFREVALCIGRITILALLTLFFVRFPLETAFLYGFGAVAVASLFLATFGGKVHRD